MGLEGCGINKGEGRKEKGSCNEGVYVDEGTGEKGWWKRDGGQETG